MKTIILPPEVCEKMLRIADSNDQAQQETIRIYVYLDEIKSLDFWYLRANASGELETHATLKCGTQIWRLFPTHVHCIALLAERDEDLFVLDVCDRAQIETVERQLIDCS